MKRILLTGCAGFIGYHLAKRLLSDSYIVIGIDNMNSYYDVSLKESRLSGLIEEPNFSCRYPEFDGLHVLGFLSQSEKDCTLFRLLFCVYSELSQ